MTASTQRVLLVVVFFIGLPAILRAAMNSLPNETGSPDATVIDGGWRLWLDTKASWKNDTLYLPNEVNLKTMPTNPPTGGWDVLSDTAGITVSLPDTVERHYWGKPPLPTANSSRASNIVSLNSPYKGVSWWYRTFTAPVLRPGERLVFSFPGARLRAEVYVNGKLVGYNFVSEIPFTADATHAVEPGKLNQLCIRITNPGGTFSWGDSGDQTWGHYSFPVTHGFGGIAAGVTMSVVGPLSVSDLYVANTPYAHTVVLHAQVTSTGPGYHGPVAFSIGRGGQSLWTGSTTVDVPAGASASAMVKVSVPQAQLWDVGHPNLYRAMATIDSVPHSARQTDFGFRWFDAVGIGTNARLELNGHRIFVSSAISWGYWAPNGIFPDNEAVQRAIDAVHAFGMNCVQTHRHFPKAAVLDGFDHAGVLRYCEPGGGGWSWRQPNNYKAPPGPVDTSGKGGEASTFDNRYELAKIEAMVKAYRSHPSVILWSMQNESAENIHNPKMFYVMRKVHQLDPSRIVVLKSGFGPQGEIMGLPYSTKMSYGESATGHDSGWHDNHNEYDSGVYQDSLYQDPTHFKTYTTDDKGIAMWGELGTGNSPDDDAAIVKWYQAHHTTGYDLAGSKARLKAYQEFLTRYGFRSAFPTAQDLFRAVGARHYFVAAKIIENARIADANDYIALTGWESTTVDNNSGLVDALRQLKSDPFLIHQANAPQVLVVRPRHYVLAKGAAAVVDSFVVNEVNRHGQFMLHFTAAMDNAKNAPFFSKTYPVTIKSGQVFGELLKSGITFTPPSAGPVTLSAWLGGGDGGPDLRRTEPMLVVDTDPAPLSGSIACLDNDHSLIPALKKQFNVDAVPLTPAVSHVDTIIINSAGTPRFTWRARKPEILRHVSNSHDPQVYSEQLRGEQGDVAHFSGMAHGILKVELFFAEPNFNTAGKRVFDVALNGKTVLSNLDIAAETGGKGKALVKTFSVDSLQGTLDLSVPHVSAGDPLFAAIRITDAKHRVIRAVFRDRAYRDATNTWWPSISNELAGFNWHEALPAIIDRVKQGSHLVVLAMDPFDAGAAARELANEKLVTFSGMSGSDNTPWIGHWYFSQKHWLLSGLPSGCVLGWQYQAAAPGDGLIINAPGMQPVIGYGKNSGPGLGFGAVVIPVKQGNIVLLGLGGLNSAFTHGDPAGFAPPTATRIVYNAIVQH